MPIPWLFVASLILFIGLVIFSLVLKFWMKRIRRERAISYNPALVAEKNRIRRNIERLDKAIPELEREVKNLVLFAGRIDPSLKIWDEIEGKNRKLDFLRQELADAKDVMSHLGD